MISVPILLLVAVSIFIFGQDHPSGRWGDRDRPNSKIDHHESSNYNDNKKDFQDKKEKDTYQGQEGNHVDVTGVDSESSVNVKEPPTLMAYFKILISPLTWLTPLAYMTTFGLELAIDSNMANVLFALFNPKNPSFTQTQAGYYTSIL
jgi:MFS transporter, NNP family, nitrate/nitrite transporter